MKIVRSSEFRVRSFGIYFLVCFLFLFSQHVFAQHTLPLDHDAPDGADTIVNYARLHSAVKPALDIDVYSQLIAGRDRLDGAGSPLETVPMYSRLTWNNYYKKRTASIDYFLPATKTAFLIRPIYDLNVGYDLKTKSTVLTTVGGIIFDADYKQKIGIEARFAAGTTAFPNYLDSITRSSSTIPGWGDRAYETSPGKYSFQHFSGNIIYRPSKVFNLQVGRDKHFWGDGYRSLFLSDIGAAMPYIKQTTTIWKLQYTSLVTWMQDWTNSTGQAKDFRSKFGTFHYLSFNAAKWLNLGLFESVIWQGNDPNRQRGFDPNYLNPVIFFRPVEYSIGSSDNAMLGASFKIRFNANNFLYAQVLLDEFYLKEILARNGWWANKQGYQLGYKCFNFGQVKNLFMQTEINIVRPYTYSHGSSQQSYSNAGMPLAHPLGANFAEVLGMLSYSNKGFTITGKLVGARYGLDTAGRNYGQNIFLSYTTRTSTVPNRPLERDFNHKLFDGVGTNIFYAELRTSYKFNTAFPLRIELLAGARAENNLLGSKKSAYVQLGLTLPLWRSYRDF
ncbi:hypothetical protein BH11BAC7_BH11BAC7_18450 [soil metagenome]